MLCVSTARPPDCSLRIPLSRLGPSGLNRRAPSHEEFKPGAHQCVAEFVRLPALVERLAPVEADPARGRLRRLIDEFLELIQARMKNERLFNDHGLTNRKTVQRLKRLFAL